MGKKPSATLVKIPDVLIEAVKSKRVVPFLGRFAGTSNQCRYSRCASRLHVTVALERGPSIFPPEELVGARCFS
jgi:hypothetical protein